MKKTGKELQKGVVGVVGVLDGTLHRYAKPKIH